MANYERTFGPVRAVIQRVSEAAVSIDGTVRASIAAGFLVLLGIEAADDDSDIDYLVRKITSLRVFADADGKMNLDLAAAGGELLVVSQFTLHASTRKGNRPSFTAAAAPGVALALYERFIALCSTITGKPCRAGVFGAYMKVSLVNDGPVTILIDSKTRE